MGTRVEEEWNREARKGVRGRGGEGAREGRGLVGDVYETGTGTGTHTGAGTRTGIGMGPGQGRGRRR